MKIISLVGKIPIIIVDQNLLMEQWVEYFTSNTDVKEDEIACIQGKKLKFEGKKVIIAMKQTLAKQDSIFEEINKIAGIVCIDEGHLQ